MESRGFSTNSTAEVDRVGDGFRVEIAAPDHRYRFNVEALNSDPDLGFEDAEDFSFGLWAANVMNSSERQHVLLETLVDAPIDQVPDHADANSSPSLELKKSWLGQGGHSGAHRRESAG